MTINHQEYTVEVYDDPSYSFMSDDNVNTYDFEYPNDINYLDRYLRSSHHVIKVTRKGKEIASAILCECGGTTLIHENSQIVHDDYIIICASGMVYCLNIPSLSIVWKKRLDPATCFSIYKFEDDFIVHGELQISRITSFGEIKWDFSSRDIFISSIGKQAFEIIDKKIILLDWNKNTYTLDGNGKLIE
jgi:hypothetical protein